jgi:hypothetical protein
MYIQPSTQKMQEAPRVHIKKVLRPNQTSLQTRRPQYLPSLNAPVEAVQTSKLEDSAYLIAECSEASTDDILSNGGRDQFSESSSDYHFGRSNVLERLNGTVKACKGKKFRVIEDCSSSNASQNSYNCGA